MTRPPLAVRLQGGGVDRHVEHELVDGLEYGSVMPGGYSSASFSLQRDLGDVPPELYPFVRCTIFDERDGRVLNAGRLEVPGRGQPWKLTTAGARAGASDIRQPYIVVDSRWGEWERVEDSSAGVLTAPAQLTAVGGAGEAPGLRFHFVRGMVIPVNGVLPVRYPHLAGSGQRAGRVDATFTPAIAGAGVIQQQFRFLDASKTGVNSDSLTWGTAGTPQTMSDWIGSGIGTVTPIVYVDHRIIHTAGGTPGNDVTWSLVTSLRIQAARKSAAGADLLTSGDYGNTYVLPHEVVNDLLGRLLPAYDGAGASVSTASTAQITQLAYADDTTPDEVLGDLMALDPAMRWAAWEPDDAGLFRFTWDAWPTVVSWELDAPPGGLTSSGGDAGLYDTVQIRWQGGGRTHWTTYIQDVPLLTAAGVTRRTTRDLGSDAGSQGMADATAGAFLADHRVPGNAGTLAVSAPIYDRVLGRMLQPWELRAGSLVRVRNLAPSVDALNATGRDGSSVFRCTEIHYSARLNTATLTLNSYFDTIYKALARLDRFTSKVARRR